MVFLPSINLDCRIISNGWNLLPFPPPLSWLTYPIHRQPTSPLLPCCTDAESHHHRLLLLIGSSRCSLRSPPNGTPAKKARWGHAHSHVNTHTGGAAASALHRTATWFHSLFLTSNENEKWLGFWRGSIWETTLFHWNERMAIRLKSKINASQTSFWPRWGRSSPAQAFAAAWCS
jgi:hypothetical protein